jgi:hypothetical protein
MYYLFVLDYSHGITLHEKYFRYIAKRTLFEFRQRTLHVKVNFIKFFINLVHFINVYLFRRIALHIYVGMTI